MKKPPSNSLTEDLLALYVVFSLLVAGLATVAQAQPPVQRLNNLSALLLDSASVSSGQTVSFARPRDGWIFISAGPVGAVDLALIFDGNERDPIQLVGGEAMRHVTAGIHTLRVGGSARPINKLVVKAIPELIYSGLGFNPQIKSFGTYDMTFLQRDVLPNITTIIVPAGLKLDDSVIAGWHRQGKRFLAETGVNPSARTADEHAEYWTGFMKNAPFVDGIIIDEFIVNQPISQWM